jgi:type IV pilus assembly protein PilB
LLALACLVLVQTVKAERIPMRDGSTQEAVVSGFTAKGIVVVDQHGTVLIPWNRVSPSYPKHPAHPAAVPPKPVPPPGAGKPGQLAAPTQTAAAPAPKAAATAAGKKKEPAVVEVPVAGDPFTYLLFVAFAFFWLQIGCVWLLGRETILSGGIYQFWNLLALLFGPLAVVVYAYKYCGGIARFLGLRRKAVADAQPVESGLMTWDGKPITAEGNRQLGTGLTLAVEILARAVQLDASDIHFNTVTDGVNMAYRVDGMLRSAERIDPENGKKIVTAIKTAAGMDLAKLLEAQDGACHFVHGGQWYDLRLARAWAVTGESMVVRILRAGGKGTELRDLGMFPEMADIARRLAKDTAGIIVLAGPTGSGKTTTIYALLRLIVGTGRNILTIEDPVEYRLEGCTQISINTKQGMTFASALKSSVRHDPDVLLVGEMRDSESMDVAFQAGLTGHLVFTTVHASSVLATFGRLHELGLSEYLINTGLKAIICQRLVRMLCPTCRQSYVPAPQELEPWGLDMRAGDAYLFYKPVGCSLCEGSGYHGRIAIYRLLVMNNKLRGKLRPDIPVGELQAVVEESALGHVPDYAKAWLCTGVTSTEELEKHLEMFDYGKQLWHTPDPMAAPGSRQT